jgi:hypothetical protein
MRPSTTYHLAHVNLAIAREPLDHPTMAEFGEQLEPVNQLARASRGFVWAPEGDEAGNPAAVFGSERAPSNLSVLDGLHPRAPGATMSPAAQTWAGKT